MSNGNSPKHPYILVKTKILFYISLLVIVLTIVIVSISGLRSHRTLFQDSLIITSILFSIFFLFITIGLYYGFKLKDDLGKITDSIKWKGIPDTSMNFGAIDIASGADSAGGIIAGIILWIVVTIIAGILLWFFGAVLWIIILLLGAVLYWIFFRALRLVFKHSAKCKGNLVKSILYGLTFAILYNIWIYAIIFVAHYLRKNFFIPSV